MFLYVPNPDVLVQSPAPLNLFDFRCTGRMRDSCSHRLAPAPRLIHQLHKRMFFTVWRRPRTMKAEVRTVVYTLRFCQRRTNALRLLASITTTEPRYPRNNHEIRHHAHSIPSRVLTCIYSNTGLSLPSITSAALPDTNMPIVDSKHTIHRLYIRRDHCRSSPPAHSTFTSTKLKCLSSVARGMKV